MGRGFNDNPAVRLVHEYSEKVTNQQKNWWINVNLKGYICFNYFRGFWSQSVEYRSKCSRRQEDIFLLAKCFCCVKSLKINLKNTV
jgi:hypothetical protein